ncbi:Uncharacterized protein RNJ44_00759 [Nakaseomyces bracarensis]|uniref:1,3-beta-glucanosyltransferase n=1 Tax=Nakaseomyces bracarensis TaxID=273131 RepID=A0ABR4NS56_9SACH
MRIRKTILLAQIISLNFTHGNTTDEWKYDRWSSHLPTIEIKGNKFYSTSTNEQFFMKGIAYQQQVNVSNDGSERFKDPLSDVESCLRDIPYLTELGVNTIRVYHIDTHSSHDICMKALSEAGIYVLVDLAEPGVSINRDRPAWDVEIWQRYRDVIDSLHFYSNILGFFAGNEVTNSESNTDASPFVKAAIRDTKNYINLKGYRNIPVGYSTNDDINTRLNLANYFVCSDTKADFYGVNIYEWCGYSSYGTSGYKERTEEFTNYPIPVFFSEFGCNLVRPRPFTEVNALFGRKMASVWSGGIVYMYFEEENGYGVVNITANNSVKKLPDFYNLKMAYTKSIPSNIYDPDWIKPLKREVHKSLLECPERSRANNWYASDILPPTPDDEKCECLENILPCHIEPLRNEQYKNDYIAMFDYICGEIDCSEISSNGSTGKYGDYSDCETNQKLSLMFSILEFSKGNETLNCPNKNDYAWFNKDIQITSPRCREILQHIKSTSIKEDRTKDDKKTEETLDKTQSIILDLDPRPNIASISTSGYNIFIGMLIIIGISSII